MVKIDRGKISELVVATQLMEMGWQVSLPFSDSCSYDLVAESNDGLKRVQVKTVIKKVLSPTSNRYVIPLFKGGRGVPGGDNKPKQPYTKKEIDCVIGVKGNICFLVDIFEKNSVTINGWYTIQEHTWFK